MSPIRLAGGWGYFNLGDEAILAGYLERLEFDVPVISYDPSRTHYAQRLPFSVVSEREASAGRSDEALVLGGGGYLNDTWVPEVDRKIERLRKARGDGAIVTHSIEVRGFSGHRGRGLERLLSGAELSVRDSDSARVVDSLVPGGTAEVVPDAISLLYPYLERYGRGLSELKGLVLLNLMDVARRPDSGESEIPAGNYAQFFAQLVEALGQRAVGLVIGDGDQKFLSRFPDLPLVAPRTVADLISLLRSSAGVVSVRMHPALLASGLGTPVVSIPYCGKVRPTLERIGVDDLILGAASVDDTMAMLEAGARDSSGDWERAGRESMRWLERALAGSGA